MKIGIVTFVKADNYGAELQAYALQKKLNMMGFDAEVLDLEKEQDVMVSSVRTILTSFLNRINYYGIIRGSISFFNLLISSINEKLENKRNKKLQYKKHKIFNQFFIDYIRHSPKQIKLKNIYDIDLTYEVFIAGSDQIWNYMQTKRLDIFFLEFASKYKCKKISYAASFSVPDIPNDLIPKYNKYLENLDAISVREINAIEIIKKCNPQKEATLVLDPTLLLSKEEWISNLSIPDYLNQYNSIVLIYTLSGSKYIYDIAESVASRLNATIVNIKNSARLMTDNKRIIHIDDAGPKEFITLFSKAKYVITDSFHGTAFSINFNIPFTTLLKPVSNLNSRALSILELTGLNDRIIYDDGKKSVPDCLYVDFNYANSILTQYKKISLNYIKDNLSQ